MRILVVTEQWYPDYTGGTARVAQQTAAALTGRGHEVTVIAPAVDGLPADETDGALTVRRRIRRRVLPQTYTDAVEVRRHVAAAGPSSFDVALVHHPTSAVGTAWAAPGLPLAYVFHASPLREAQHRRTQGVSRAQRARSLAVEPALRWLEARAAGRANVIVTLSEFSRSLIARDHPAAAERVIVAGGGVDVRTYAPSEDRAALRRDLGVPDGEHVLLTVRRLVPRMGVGLLLEAFALLRREGHPGRLVVLGSGELRDALERRRDDLGLAGAVQFRGRVTDAELEDWYRAADLFVLPTVAYEGFGMVTAEALACGTPVVGTPVGATAEVLGPLDPGLVAEAAEAGAIASCLRDALGPDGAPSRDACREYAVRSFDWRTVIARWEQACEAAVEAAR